jgi:hypothetical protein
MASTTTTETIALELINNAARDSDSARDLAGPGASNFDPAADAVVAESRIADAEVPDGGYGWVVIAACSVLCFWFVGTPYSWGVIQAALVKDRVSTPASLSFVGSLTAACISFLALANARLIRKIGGRNTALAGAAFLGTGGILSSFTTRNVGGLFFTTGVLMGTGCSLQFMVCCILEDFSPTMFTNPSGKGCFDHARAVLQQETWAGEWYRLRRRGGWRHRNQLCHGWPDPEIRP